MIRNAMKRAAVLLPLFPALLYGQEPDTTPRGPLEWTPRNWIGLALQLTLFALAVYGIYRLTLRIQTEGEEDARPDS